MTSDGHLIRFGFMSPRDVGTWIERLEDWGLTFLRTDDETPVAVDIVVVDQVSGPTCACDWIECELVDGHRWVWLKGHKPNTFLLPVDPKERGMRRVLYEDAEGLPFSHTQGLDMSIDQETGKTTYTARVFKEAHLYDIHIRRARIAASTGDGFEALSEYLEAEKHEVLSPRDRLAAARTCLWVFQALGGVEMESVPLRNWFEIELLRRWVEVTELGPGEMSTDWWCMRADVELAFGRIEESQLSRQRASELS
jgi:hypothetical protein